MGTAATDQHARLAERHFAESMNDHDPSQRVIAFGLFGQLLQLVGGHRFVSFIVQRLGDLRGAVWGGRFPASYTREPSVCARVDIVKFF